MRPCRAAFESSHRSACSDSQTSGSAVALAASARSIERRSSGRQPPEPWSRAMPRIARATNVREASTRKAARKFESHQYMVTAADKRCRDEMRHSGNAAGDYSGGAAGYYSGNAAGNYSGNAAATTAATPLVPRGPIFLKLRELAFGVNKFVFCSFWL